MVLPHLSQVLEHSLCPGGGVLGWGKMYGGIGMIRKRQVGKVPLKPRRGLWRGTA